MYSVQRLRHSLNANWYIYLVLDLAAVSLLVRLLLSKPVQIYILSIEKELVILFLNLLNIKTINISYNTFIVIHNNIMTIRIVPSCSGIYAVVVFVSSALLMPRISLRSKINAIIIYAPLVFFGNIVRIVSIIAIGSAFGPQAMNIAHNYVGTIFTVTLFATLWLDWFYRSTVALRRNRTIKQIR